MAEKIVQAAGRAQLGDFAPAFAHLNDDVLFGEVWNEAAVDVKTKCIITIGNEKYVFAADVRDGRILPGARCPVIGGTEIPGSANHATEIRLKIGFTR